MEIILNIAVFFLNIIYAFHKLAPTKNQVAVISRQSEKVSLDARMLLEEIKAQDPDIEVKALYKMIPPGIGGKIRYILHMLGPEMHTLATSRVVVLEGYVISVSILKHKKDLKILQMWHALGIFKRFGYMVADEEEGHSSAVIRGLRMHQGYDMILASSEFVRPYYAEAFNYPVEAVKVLPLPRVDRIRSEEFMADRRQKIEEKFPELSEHPIILYAPTLRRGTDVSADIQRFIQCIDREKYRLVVKLHPVLRKEVSVEGVFTCPGFSSLEVLSVADYVVTDYSAFVFEAACAGKPLFFYAPDLTEYLSRRGLCIDYMSEMPNDPKTKPEEVAAQIDAGDYDLARVKAFADKFVAGGDHNTTALAKTVRLLYNNE